jgi:DNA-binding CsgD family transcriptional regulator
MKIINHLVNILFNHQKKLEIAAILLLCLSISFRFDGGQTKWLWNDYSFVAVMMSGLVILIALIWIRIEKSKTNQLIEAIKMDREPDQNRKQSRINDLSARQREVYELIVSGMSNKEIMLKLSIELSTLKTHINKIYKILEVGSRQQIRRYKNETN